MIRRKAALVGTGDPGFCLGWLVKIDSEDNQTMVFIFENKTTQLVNEQPLNNIKFTDGQPDIIPEIE